MAHSRSHGVAAPRAAAIAVALVVCVAAGLGVLSLAANAADAVANSEKPSRSRGPSSAVQVFDLTDNQGVAGNDRLPLLLVTTLSGSVSALRASDGRELWTVEYGQPLVQAHQNLRIDEQAGQEPVVLPAPDGSILLHRGREVQRFPVNIQQLAMAPPNTNQELRYLGSVNAAMLEVGLVSGHVRQLHATCPLPDSSYLSVQESEPTVSLAIRIHSVKAIRYDGSMAWNVTISETLPPVVPSAFAHEAERVDPRLDFDLITDVRGHVTARSPNGSDLWTTSLADPIASVYSLDARLQVAQVDFTELAAAQQQAGTGQSACDTDGRHSVYIAKLSGGQLVGLPQKSQCTAQGGMGAISGPPTYSTLPSRPPDDQLALPYGGADDEPCDPMSPNFKDCLTGLYHLKFEQPSMSMFPDLKLIAPPAPEPPAFSDLQLVAIGGVGTSIVVMVAWWLSSRFSTPKPVDAPPVTPAPIPLPAPAPAPAAPVEPPAPAAPAPPAVVVIDNVEHVVYGSLAVSDTVLGHGSHGTVVFDGRLGERRVAVKRVLRNFFQMAAREIGLLIKSDGHPNVVRYFAREECGDFVYLALEKCEQTLEHALLLASGRRRKHFKKKLGASGGPPPPATSLVAPPSQATREFMKDLVAGLAHLHTLRIAHRDLKPQNILLAQRVEAGGSAAVTDASREQFSNGEFHNLGKFWRPKISDMGLGKLLASGNSSFGGSKSMLQAIASTSASSSSARAPGSVGWQAPEVLRSLLAWRRGEELLVGEAGDSESVDDDTAATRHTRAVDVWSLGCILYAILDPGEHPYGEFFERESNILKGNLNLGPIAHIPEAMHLVSRMLHDDPTQRPSAEVILEHPLFWSDAQRLAFMLEFSDRLEPLPSDSYVVVALEKNARLAVGRDWKVQLAPELLEELLKHRRYDFSSAQDCVRLIRNKRNHFHELPPRCQDMLGHDASQYYHFFATRFPHLFMVIYDTCLATLAHEPSLARHLGAATARMAGPASLALAEQAAAAAAALSIETSALAAVVNNAVNSEVSIEADGTVHRSWYSAVPAWLGVTALLPPMTEEQSYLDTRFRGGFHVDDPRYKTRMCKDWEMSGGKRCPRGARCDFAHGTHELRVVPKAPRGSGGNATQARRRVAESKHAEPNAYES